MRMSKRKSRSVLLAVIMVLVLMVQACASGGSGNGNNGNNTVPNPPPSSGSNGNGAEGQADNGEPAASELDPYEVSIIYFGTPEQDVPLVEEKLSEHFKAKFNATVKLIPIASSDYKTRTELMMNTGEKMDLVFTASWLNYFGNVPKGAYLELDELLEKHGQGIIERLNPLYLEAPRMNGKLYAIPTNKEITQGYAYTYRKDIVEKYQIPIESINNTDDLMPWLEKVQAGEPDMIPYYIAGGSGNFGGGGNQMYVTRSSFFPIGPTPAKMPLFLVDSESADQVTVKTVLDPEIVAINQAEIERLRAMYEKGLINSDAATSTTEISDHQRDGKIWVQPATWKPGSDIEMGNSVNNEYEYVSHVVSEPIVTTDLATGSMFSISRTSEDPERAMMVLNELHSDPYVVNLIVHGIEDKHYKKVGENRIEQIPDSGYGKTAYFWVVGNQLINYLKPGQPDDLYTNWEKFNNEAKRFPLMGFVFDETNVKNEITQLTAVVTEYKSIYTGAVKDPVKLLEDRNRRLKDAGIERVRDEIQTQIDAWRASNG